MQVGAKVSVAVPASSANLGPGFDSIGLALGLWDQLDVEVGGDRLQIECTGEACDEIPRDESHLIYRSMVAAWQRLEVAVPTGLRLTSRNAIPHSRGLGSSASAIVAGVAAAAQLAGVAIDSPDGQALINDVASGLEGHPDNASASVYGGLTVSWADDSAAGSWLTAQVAVHPDVVPVVLVPSQQLSTHEARAALPATVALPDAAANSGRAALLVHALTQRPDLLLPATRDWLHQEPRRPAYPATMAMLDDVRRAGHAAAVSGAGPSVLVLATSQTVAEVTAVASVNPGWTVLTPGVSSGGVRVVSRSAHHTV